MFVLIDALHLVTEGHFPNAASMTSLTGKTGQFAVLFVTSSQQNEFFVMQLADMWQYKGEVMGSWVV